MRRRPLGRGRILAIAGAVVLLVGAFLPWYTLGGTGELPGVVFHGFRDGSGILAFLAALGTLALVTLPYAAGERPVGVDRGLGYALLAALAFAGVLLWIPTVLDAPEGLLPDRALGYWVTIGGAVILGRAAFEIATEPPRR